MGVPQTSVPVLQERVLTRLTGSSPTFRSVLRTQMKVQTDGLLLHLRTTNPPGPFSPLTSRQSEREGQSGEHTGGASDWKPAPPDEAAARRLAVVDGRHAGGHVAVAFPLHPSDIHKVPEERKRSFPQGGRARRRRDTRRPVCCVRNLAETTPPAAPEETS